MPDLLLFFICPFNYGTTKLILFVLNVSDSNVTHVFYKKQENFDTPFLKLQLKTYKKEI